MEPSTFQIIGWVLAGGIGTAVVTHVFKWLMEGTARRRAAEQHLDRTEASRLKWRDLYFHLRTVAREHGVPGDQIGPLPEDPYSRDD